jgi:hypothetical protein
MYIQDVIFPTQLVDVLTTREIAKQQEQTYQGQKSAQDKRIELEASKGRADMQTDLAKSAVGIEIARNNATAVQETANGESYRLEKVGRASAVQTEAQGLAVAAGLEAQLNAIGKDQTAVVNVFKALAEGEQSFMPENLAITVGDDAGLNGMSGLVPLLMRYLQTRRPEPPTPPAQTNGGGKV